MNRSVPLCRASTTTVDSLTSASILWLKTTKSQQKSNRKPP
nr:MAG TPA: hypothetical protein [Caudoviricetes sp.]